MILRNVELLRETWYEMEDPVRKLLNSADLFGVIPFRELKASLRMVEMR